MAPPWTCPPRGPSAALLWSCSCWSSSSHPSLYLTQNFVFNFGPRAFNFKNRAEIAATATMTVSVTDLPPSPPKLPRRHTKHPLPFCGYFFSFSQSRNTAFHSCAVRVKKKIHKVPWPQLKPAVTVSHAHTEIAGSSWYDPLPSNKTPAPCIPRVRAWKDRAFLDHFKSIFNLFN